MSSDSDAAAGATTPENLNISADDVPFTALAPRENSASSLCSEAEAGAATLENPDIHEGDVPVVALVLTENLDIHEGDMPVMFPVHPENLGAHEGDVPVMAPVAAASAIVPLMAQQLHSLVAQVSYVTDRVDPASLNATAHGLTEPLQACEDGIQPIVQSLGGQAMDDSAVVDGAIPGAPRARAGDSSAALPPRDLSGAASTFGGVGSPQAQLDETSRPSANQLVHDELERKAMLDRCHELNTRLSHMQFREALGARPRVALTRVWVRHAVGETLITRIALADYERVGDLKLMLADRFRRNPLQVFFVAPNNEPGITAEDHSPTEWLLPSDGSDDTIRVVGLGDLTSASRHRLPRHVCQHIQRFLFRGAEQLDREDDMMEIIQSMAEKPEVDVDLTSQPSW